MNIFKRGMIFVTFFGCCFGMSLMAASLGTKFWFEATARQRDVTKNFTVYRPEAEGKVNFGLFEGVKVLNWGIGDRTSDFEVPPGTPDLLSQSLWISTITFLCLALLFAVLGAIFAVINTATTPIEAITGVPGLYAWNILAAFFTLLCVIFWSVEFHQHLISNVLVEERHAGWTTEGEEHLGYSFWLVVVSMIIHIANCVIIYVGTFEPKVKTQYEAPETKPGNIMLY